MLQSAGKYLQIVREQQSQIFRGVASNGRRTSELIIIHCTIE